MNTFIKIQKREDNIFHCITREGQKMAFETAGERDPRFAIMMMYYLEDRQMEIEGVLQ